MLYNFLGKNFDSGSCKDGSIKGGKKCLDFRYILEKTNSAFIMDCFGG